MTNIRELITGMRLLSAFIFAAPSSQAYSEELIDWKNDCVGHMQISIPGEADIAYTPLKSMFENKSSPRFIFPDGTRAGWSWLTLVGPIHVSNQLSDVEIEAFIEEAKEMEKRAQEYARSNKADNESRPDGDFERIQWGENSKSAIRVNQSFLFALVLNRQAVTLQSSVDKEWLSQHVLRLKSVISNMAYRENFSIPTLPGVCMPSLFVKGVEEKRILAATTYRLKEHPDITILLEDSMARRPGKYERPEVFTAVYKSNFFWTQDYQDYDSIENLLKFRRHNKIPFAGQRAVESKVRMIRSDKITEDFGYLVVTQGNPDAKVDTPDLMLYVIRDAQQAIKRGIKPVPKKEFFKLARQIADSVKHRGATPSEK
ncbi:hypothetical protein [Herbaspirillum huttiense]|uniref:Tle cognate immunity protein 4 C-terminal domain-containing protein n=2 Tax=Herbaspirillum huttiense TaxID=863372 RepID=A0AAJ2H9Z3_9BURK|nr:hypothetical protein [Herbaspirillum huttiense]MDR9839662.1 hypothetical protein [Herbaspirillum huttiense]